MTGTPIIGGKADGQQCPAKLPRINLDGEVYMLVVYRDEKGGQHPFYQLAGLVPAEVVRIWKERFGK